MIIICQRLLKSTKIIGITLFPFILLRDKRYKSDQILLNHEKIHLRQQMELLIVFFYIWYLSEFLYKVIKFKNKYSAYREISFEREAYDNEQNPSYLENRKLWAFWIYL